MGPHRFKATPDEVEFVEWIRQQTLRKSTATFTRDTGMRILVGSGFSYEQIREIWTIADRNGDGTLSNEELCVLVRLAGWVQHLESGVPVSESLLKEAGPLPMLKGISCIPQNGRDSAHNHQAPDRLNQPHVLGAFLDRASVPRKALASIHHHDESRERHQPRPQSVYPPVTLGLKETCRRMFERADTADGLIDRETAKEILIEHFGDTLFGLRAVLDLVRTTHLFSLDILEFTLAAYFIVGLQTGTIKTLPTEVPEELFDQLWMPTPLRPHKNSVNEMNQRRTTDRIASVDELPALSAPNNYQPTPVRLLPILKKPHSLFTGRCPSISSVETKTIWKRVAQKILQLSSTRKRDHQRGSISCSDISVKGTIHTEWSESSVDATETFLRPTKGHKVPMGSTHLPLVYPSETGRYVSPNPVSPVSIPHSIDADGYVSDNIARRSSVTVEQVGGASEGTTSTRSSSSLDETILDNVEIAEESVQEERESKVSIKQVFDMLTGMKEEYTMLSQQLENIQETIQKLEWNGLSAARSVHFVRGGTDASLEKQAGNPVQLLSKTSRETEPLEILSSGSRMVSSSTRIGPGGNNHICRQERSERVRGPRQRRRESESSLTSFSSSSASLSESGSTRTKPVLRSILKVKVHHPQTQEEIKHNSLDSLASSEQKPPATAAATKHQSRNRATKGFGISKEMLQTWNARFVSVDKIPTDGDRILATTEGRKLPRLPRKLPVVGAVEVKPVGAPTVSLPSKFSCAFADDGPGASLSRRTGFTTSRVCNDTSHEDMNTGPSPSVLSELLASTLRDSLSPGAPPDSRRASVGTTFSDIDIDTSHTSCSAAGYSSLFSRRRQSTRTTLLTEIDEYNDTVLNDLQETAPQFMQQVKKIVLQDMRTKAGRSVTNMGDTVFDSGCMTTTWTAPPRFSPPRYSQVFEESEHDPTQSVFLASAKRQAMDCGSPREIDQPPHAENREPFNQVLERRSKTLEIMKKTSTSIQKISRGLSGYFINIAKPRRNETKPSYYASSLCNASPSWPLVEITDYLLA